MNLLPYENIKYKTNLTAEEVFKRLVSNTELEPKKIFHFRINSIRDYRGEVGEKEFKICRVINYRNSFLPRISGTIEKNMVGTIINIKMKLNLVVAIFVIIWFNGIVGGSVHFLMTKMTTNDDLLFRIIPLAMLVFGYALVMVGFKYESIKSKKYFKELFEAEIIPSGKRK